MLICESCRAKTTTLFNCHCRLLICHQCKEGQHKPHVPAEKVTKAPSIPEPAGQP